MTGLTFIWIEGDDGNIAHCAEHGVTTGDVEFVFENAGESDVDVSESSDRPIVFGDTPDGRTVAVVFEWVEVPVSVYVINAYEV